MTKRKDPFMPLLIRKIEYQVLLHLAGSNWKEWKEFHKENMESDIDEKMLRLAYEFSKHIFFGDEAETVVPKKGKYFYNLCIEWESCVLFSDIKNFQDYISWEE